MLHRTAPRFLEGGGVCGEVIRSIDWSKTPLGSTDTWSPSLKTALGIVLHSRHPMFLFWGPEHIQFYNDAFIPSFGEGVHPAAIGMRGRECWRDIWDVIGPQIEDAMKHGKPSWNVDHLIPILRNGRMEEVYWSYGYSPVPDSDEDEDEIGGALVVCTETTERILSDRRLGLLRALSLQLASVLDPADVVPAAAVCVAESVRDLPCVFFRLKGTSAVATAEHTAVAQAVLDEVLSAGVERPEKRTLKTALPGSLWPEPVTDAFVVPIERSPHDVVVFGLSSRLPFDRAYEGFLKAIVDVIVQARARAQVESARRSLLLDAPVATALLTGPEHRFQLANRLFHDLVAREVIGRTYREAFPELADSVITDFLDRVFQTGRPVSVHELSLPLVDQTTGAVEERFFRFNLQPVRTEGNVTGIMAVALEITEQVKARRFLEETGRERARLLADAQAAARAKDEFFAILGHELRNPLAPILTALEVMRLKGSEQNIREREIIERQSRHLVHLVDDLLDVSRVTRGKIELKKSRVALLDVVTRAVEIASPLFEQKAHDLRIEVDGVGLEVDADPVRLSQVVANLLTNAAKYTPPNGRVVVRAAREGDRILLHVEDNGSGIPPEQLPHLFDAFFQGPRPKDRAEGGLGLGLTLVKSLITLHGGSVSAESEGPGKGSVFTLSIPTIPVTKADAVHAAPAQGLAVDVSPPRSPTRLLMVDDNTDMAELLSELLERVGFDVRVANDGPSALEVATRFRPAIAVLDIGLPVMDGYELAAKLRERLGSDAPRMIAMSGYGQREDREHSRRAGFELHLVKPVDVQSLLSAVRDRSPAQDTSARAGETAQVTEMPGTNEAAASSTR